MRLSLFFAAGASAVGLGFGAQATPQLAFPLACKIGATCEVQNLFDHDPGPGVRDYRCGGRTYDGHNGVDIRLLDMAAQRRGVDVLAAAAGRVADVSIRAPGAPSVKDQECGNGVVIDHGDGWETQYCHLAKGSVRVKVGQQVRAGEPLARVGLSGNTEFPHLHLSVRRAGANIDPFAPVERAGCALQPELWTPQAAKALAYKTGAVLNAGFSSAPVTMEALEAGGLPPAVRTGGVLVAYVRAIGLQKGDVVELTVSSPDGAVLVTRREPPLPANRAQQFLFIGKKRPPGGWAAGPYRAVYRVHRGRTVALERTFAASL